MDLYNLFLMLFYCGKNAECELSSLTCLRAQYGTVIYRCNVVGRTLALILLASLKHYALHATSMKADHAVLVLRLAYVI